MSEALVWVDGSFDAKVDPRDRGFTLGDGVFDTLVAFNQIPFAGDRHLDRLVAQAASIGIPADAEPIRAGWNTVLGRAGSAPHILRTTVTRGVAARGLWPSGTRAPPTIAVSATPWNASVAGKETRLVIASIRRNPSSPSSRLKTLGYLDHVLAAREAAEKNADDALFLGPEGKALCSTIANLFAISGRKLLTPPVADGVMPGITRALLLEAAESARLTPEEHSLLPLDLVGADAVFLANSARFISPVLSVEGVAMSRRGADAEAALRKLLAAMVREECGFDLLGA